MCEKFCGIWANIAAQIASEALRIQVHRRAVQIKLLTKFITTRLNSTRKRWLRHIFRHVALTFSVIVLQVQQILQYDFGVILKLKL